MLVSIFISSVSQILLKLSTRKSYASRVAEYLNPLVVIAYGLFFLSTFVTMYALKGVPLGMAPIIEASGYLFVALLGRIILKETISGKKLLGLGVILLGIVIYAV